MPDAFDAAIADLRRHRQEVMAEVAKSPLGKKLAKIDEAIAVLTRADEAAAQNGMTNVRSALAQSASSVPEFALPPKTNPHRSVKAIALTVLESADQAWSYEDILAEAAKMGEPIRAADPRSALRTAVWQMIQDGQAVKSAHGSYKAAKFAVTTEEAML